MTQQSLFTPGEGGREIATRLLHRAHDPQTSRDAAAALAPHLVECQHRALAIISDFGPGTLREIAIRFTGSEKLCDGVYHELARRAPELAREGLIDYQRDARGLAVRVDGARVWEVME